MCISIYCGFPVVMEGTFGHGRDDFYGGFFPLISNSFSFVLFFFGEEASYFWGEYSNGLHIA